jgi:hypothetical protein
MLAPLRLSRFLLGLVGAARSALSREALSFLVRDVRSAGGERNQPLFDGGEVGSGGVGWLRVWL